MISEISSFWSSLPAPFQQFLVGVSVNLMSKVVSIRGGKGKDDISEPLKDACKEGIKCFTKSCIDNNCDENRVRKLLGNSSLESLFAEIVDKPDLAADTSYIKKIVNEISADCGIPDGFNLEKSLALFLEGFTAKAEKNTKLIPYLELQILRKILDNQKGAKPDLQYLQTKYFDYIRAKYRLLSFKGLSDRGKVISFPLNEIFMELTLAKDLYINSREYLKKRENNIRPDEMSDVKGGVVDISDIFSSSYSIILGEPGSGKSTLLKFLALNIIDPESPFFLKDTIPILFPISAYAEGYKRKNSLEYNIKESLSEYFRGEGLPDMTPLFDTALNENRSLLLFDGLDEVANESERKKVVADIRTFITSEGYKDNRYIITCRVASYTKATRFEKVNDNKFSHYTVLPFDNSAIRSFLNKWYLCYERDINERGDFAEIEAEKRLHKMCAIIETDGNIRDLATNPLMLTILALIEHEGGDLPRNRAALYEKCLIILSDSWDKVRSLFESERSEFRFRGRRISQDFVVEYLGPVAYEMHKNSKFHIEHGELKEILAGKFDRKNKDMLCSKEEAEDFIKIMQERSGILQEVATGVYGFMHLTFKEYLSARVLTDLSDNCTTYLGDNIFKPEWQKVVLLTASILKKRDATTFIRDIVKTGSKCFENLLLAGRCIVDAGVEKVDEEFYDEFVEKLEGVVAGDFQISDKAPVAETLGRLGVFYDLEGFVEIEGGEYNLSSGKVQIEVFKVGKYPVTNSWYGKFIKDNGYNNCDYWSGEGLKWLEYTKSQYPLFWNDSKWNCPNSPVVGITWYEAYAFTKWLTVKSDDGCQYRLPNEHEWEAAAFGHAGRKYPWGNKWDMKLCNNKELKIGKTTPVGMFRDGNTSKGVSDLCGNVWEWTLSDYFSGSNLNDYRFDEEVQRKMDNNDIDAYISLLENRKSQLPVLKGGSYFNDKEVCLCSARIRYSPHNRYYNAGFRCARPL